MSVYYQHSGKIGLASQLSYQARQRLFQRFMGVIQPTEMDTVLDIGVTSDTQFQESNFFEKFYPYKSQITCTGTEDGQHLQAEYPGLCFIQVTAGDKMPFEDQQFDIAFSNAVIEHVGALANQQGFVAEACRVAKRVFITTPNRWFPVEHHTSVLLLHYLPKAAYRAIIRRTPLSYWANEAHLNLLTLDEFRQCFPAGYPVVVERTGVGWGVMLSNLIAYTYSS